MYKNHQMKGIIKTLKRDLIDHQEVEKELAKRSHFCQKVIKKYREQIKQLREDITRERQAINNRDEQSPQNKDDSDLMNYLNSRITQYEVKLRQTQVYLKAQEQEYEELLQKVFEIKTRYGKCALLLSEFVEFFAEKDPSLLSKQDDIFLDID